MAETKLVKDQAKEGEMLIQKLLENHFDISGACWLLHSEKEDWKLYIVSTTANEKGAEAQQALRAAFDQIPDLWMDFFDVRLIDPSSHIAQEIAAINSRSPVRLKDRHYIKLGGMSTAYVHVYPIPTHA